MFVLPGFIIKSIIDTLNPPRKATDSSFFFGCLAYSLVNSAIFSWAFILIRPLERESNWYWFILLSITLVGSVLIAIPIALIKQRRLIYKIAKKWDVSVIDPTPTAWDYWFSRSEPSFVLITLDDGSEIRGLFGEESFASSDPQDRDIFLEKLYLKENNSEAWKDNPENDGLYISKDTIMLIEFKRVHKSGGD